MSKKLVNIKSRYISSEVVSYQPESGSAADFYMIQGVDGAQVLRKIAKSEGVENGITKLRHEVAFIKDLPATVKHLFPTILYSHVGEQPIYYDMPFLFGGNTLYHWCIGNSTDSKTIEETLTNILRELDRCLYAEGRQPAPPDFLEIAHLNRVRRRLLLAASWSTRLHDLMSADSLIINGRICQSVLALLDGCGRAISDEKFQPRFVGLTHGDLNAHNILLDPNDLQCFVLIDPRGILDTGLYRDYLYDVGKLYLSFNGFHEMRSGLAELTWHNESEVEISFKERAAEHSSRIRKILKSVVETWMSRSSNADPNWRHRLAFSEACHFLADVPCRMFRARDENIGIIFYLHGLLLLNGCLTHRSLGLNN